MARRKLSDMTPYERVDSRLKGMSWEEAEEVGIEILARCIAAHLVGMQEEDYAEGLFERLFKRSYEWAKENTFQLGVIRSVSKQQQSNN